MKSFKLTCILIIFILFIVIIGFIKTYEGFNTDFPQSKYKPNRKTPIPTAVDGTPYVSPNEKGDCPNGFQRDRTNPNSLCHGACSKGNFYYDDTKMFNNAYGCVKLNTSYPQKNYPKADYPFAKDGKTNIVSPTTDAKCPKFFELDLNTGLCYTKCDVGFNFYGEIGCVRLNTSYPQSSYNNENPYPTAEDGTTRYVSPTSTATCPYNFLLDYRSGLCHTRCGPGKKFSGDQSGCN